MFSNKQLWSFLAHPSHLFKESLNTHLIFLLLHALQDDFLEPKEDTFGFFLPILDLVDETPEEVDDIDVGFFLLFNIISSFVNPLPKQHGKFLALQDLHDLNLMSLSLDMMTLALSSISTCLFSSKLATMWDGKNSSRFAVDACLDNIIISASHLTFLVRHESHDGPNLCLLFRASEDSEAVEVGGEDAKLATDTESDIGLAKATGELMPDKFMFDKLGDDTGDDDADDEVNEGGDEWFKFDKFPSVNLIVV